ncbi:MAG TPA: glycerol-3-phosphate 1-O-acyltransferase PlsY [Verrucomicrobiae bacterium]
MPAFAYIIVAVAAYLLGSMPTGFLVAKAMGIDIQKAGSGNIGATNAMRVLGKPAGIFVMLVDAAKGYAVCYLGLIICDLFGPNLDYIASHPVPDYTSMVESTNLFSERMHHFAILAGIFAVIGHNYPCWLKFKGGKGIATTAGVYLALAPAALGIALAVFILSIVITRCVSVGSIVAAAVLPVAVWFTKEKLFLEVVTIALCMLAIYKHKSNIKRLMAGTESRLGKKPEDAK